MFGHCKRHSLNLLCAFGLACIRPPCSCTSQHDTVESQLLLTKMLAVGLQHKLLMPSEPALGTLQSFGSIDFAGIPGEELL